LAVLGGHSYLYWRGAMSSNGEVRYMLVVAPFWALLSARGWSWVFGTFNWKRPLALAGLAALLPIGVNWMYKVLPVVTMPDWREAEQIADWYRKNGASKEYPHLASSHPALLYWLDMSPTDPRRIEWRKDIIDSHPLPPGTILIWDRIGAMFNSDSSRTISLDELYAAGWKPMEPSEVPVNGISSEALRWKSRRRRRPRGNNLLRIFRLVQRSRSSSLTAEHPLAAARLQDAAAAHAAPGGVGRSRSTETAGEASLV
jgi:hypothetical protein